MSETFHKIINGETVEELKKLPSGYADLIFADPPYWMRTDGVLKRVEGTDYNGCGEEWDRFETLSDYEEFTEKWLKECYRVLKKDGSFWVIGGMQCIYTVGAIMQRLGFWIINDVIWHKKNPTPNFLGTRLNNSHETLIWAAKGRKARYTFNYKTAKELNLDTVSREEYEKGARKQLGSVWRISVCQGSERLKDDGGEKLHTTQKPEELLYRVIAVSSKKGDLVLDPFGGTMTTAAAAKRLGRNSVMIEIDKKYCEYGRKRVDGVEYEDTAVARADFDRKPEKAAMPDMIAAGYFSEGESFFLSDGKECATLNKDGKLLFRGKNIDMHSAAAMAKDSKAKRLNGFDIWFVKRADKLVSIARVREDYRKNKNDKK